MKLRTILTTYACVGSLLLAQACSARANDPGGRPPGEGPGPGPGPVDPTEKVLKDAPFPVGAALVPALLRTNSAYAETVKNEMNSVTPENAMKMDALSLGPGQYKYTDADYLVKFAEDNGMRVHGHALVWYYIVPSWIRNFQGDRDAWIDLMTTYITDVVTHFKGKVTSWDVVNESFLDDGSWREGNDDPLKNDIWYEKIGEDYIEIAFRAAHAADPDALLFYNDYGMEWSKSRRDHISAYVTSLKNKGVPIHGIGLQMHAHIDTGRENISAALTAAASTGLLVHISELDIEVNHSKNPNAVFTDQLAQRQKEAYKSMFEAFMAVPKDKQYGISFWGVDDAHSWLTPVPDWPLPFDKNFKKKPAYYGMTETFPE